MTPAMLLLGVLTVVTSLAVVFARKPLNSALWLVLALFLVAGHFALLDAHFIAAVQVLVYAGAIMVLVVFVVMLLGVAGEVEGGAGGGRGRFRALSLWTGLPLALGFVALLVFAVRDEGFLSRVDASSAELPPGFGTAESIGAVLFSDYVFPFEVTSLLLLAAMIGAVVLALEAKRPLAPGRGLRAMRGKALPEQEASHDGV